MSKPLKTISLTFAVFVLILQFFYNSYGQIVEIKINLDKTETVISGKLDNSVPQKNLWFLQNYAGQVNLTERFSEISLHNQNGRIIEYKQLADGEFLAQNDFQTFNYKAKLTAINPTAMAHVSWLDGEQGILMLGDLIPQFGGKVSAKITFGLPKDWRVVSSETKTDENSFLVENVENAIFYIGKNVRELNTGNNKLNFSLSGEFLFKDEDAAQMASEIFADYENLFGGISPNRKQILLVRYPKDVKFGRWEAETRGSTVMILSADMPFSTQSEQKIHEQLRHEIFHLWVPNSLNLSGNYDWFFEGFALYQSLRTGVSVNRIRFEDFLDTLSRAFDIDTMISQKKSLIEASKNRWNGANTQVYARGMLVGFLIDAAILSKSKGKKTLSEVFREIYQKHNLSSERKDGNEAILKILESRRELRSVIEKYIKGAENIAWQTDLEGIGIETVTENFSTKLKVKTKLNGRQKDLLDKLGYNNWRNFSRKTK
jgi:predicted metalloprotease with PDZ domain